MAGLSSLFSSLTKPQPNSCSNPVSTSYLKSLHSLMTVFLDMKLPYLSFPKLLTLKLRNINKENITNGKIS